MDIMERVAYLKGLMEGMEIDTDKKEGKLLAAIVDVLEEIALDLEDLWDNTLELTEGLDAVSDDLSDVETYIYEMDGEYDEDDDEDDEDEDEDDEDFDDDWFEVECPTCEETLVIDDEALEEGYIECPNCESRFALDLSDDVVEADED